MIIDKNILVCIRLVEATQSETTPPYTLLVQQWRRLTPRKKMFRVVFIIEKLVIASPKEERFVHFIFTDIIALLLSLLLLLQRKVYSL